MRLFIAVTVQQVVQENLVKKIREIKKEVHHSSWVPYQNYHVTMHYIGHYAATERICYAMEETAKEINPFTVEIHRLEPFLRSQSAMLTAKVENNRLLQLFYDELRLQLIEMQVPVEKRRFSPRITLARSLPIDVVMKYAQELNELLLWEISSFTLYNSWFIDGHMVINPLYTQMLMRESTIKNRKEYK